MNSVKRLEKLLAAIDRAQMHIDGAVHRILSTRMGSLSRDKAWTAYDRQCAKRDVAMNRLRSYLKLPAVERS